MARGGKREGAGRPSRGLATTKATVYVETRNILNEYAKNADITVVELLYKIVSHRDFKVLVDFILKEKK